MPELNLPTGPLLEAKISCRRHDSANLVEVTGSNPVPPTIKIKGLRMQAVPLFSFLLPFCYYFLQRWHFPTGRWPLDWRASSGGHRRSRLPWGCCVLSASECILGFRPVQLAGSRRILIFRPRPGCEVSVSVVLPVCRFSVKRRF